MKIAKSSGHKQCGQHISPAPTTYHSIAPCQPNQNCPPRFSKPQTQRSHQPVNFRRILLLLLPDTTRSLHHQHQTSTIKLLLLQQLSNHKSKSIQKPALPLNPFRHRFLLLQAQSEHFWNFVATRTATTKKCELTIVNENALTNFHTIFPLTHFLFHFLFYSLLVIFTSYLSISVSYFGCLTTSCRIFDPCYNHSCVTIFHAYTGTVIFGGPYIFDVSKLFPMKILLLTLRNDPCCSNLKLTAEKSIVPHIAPK